MSVATSSSTQITADMGFENLDFISAIEAALYLRIFRKDGTPCVERIRNLVNKGKLPFYKPFGRLLFKKAELKAVIESSKKGGFKWR